MSHEAALRILRAVIGSFDDRVLPTLTDDTSKIYGGLISHALKFVEASLREQECAADSRSKCRKELSSQAAMVLDHDQTWSAATSSSDRFGELLALLSQDDARRLGALQLLTATVKAETDYLSALDPGCLGGAGDSYRGGRHEPERDSPRNDALSAQSLNRWARERWREAEGAQIADLVLMPGGFSKTTAFFTLRRANADQFLVLRRDLPVPLMGQTVVDEFPLLRKLHASGLAVAKPLCVEAEPKYIDGAFMVSERLTGSVDFTAWKSDRQSVLKVARQFAGLLARVHGMDLETIGYSAQARTRSAYDCMREEINRWYSLYRSKMREEQPLLELTFAWLKKNIPESLKQRPARLLHGDAGFHNLLVDQGSISALLDWEFHHLGDPVEDLCYARQFIAQVMQWEEFLEFYEAAGGISYPPEDDFFSVWTVARNPAGCIDSIALFDNTLPDAVQLAVAGYIFGPRLQVAACDKILTILGQRMGRDGPVH